MKRTARGYLIVPFEVEVPSSASRQELMELAEDEVLPRDVEASDIDVQDWGI